MKGRLLRRFLHDLPQRNLVGRRGRCSHPIDHALSNRCMAKFRKQIDQYLPRKKPGPFDKREIALHSRRCMPSPPPG